MHNDNCTIYGKQLDHQIERAAALTRGYGLFTTPNGDYWIKVKGKRGWKSYRLGSQEFEAWLQRAYFEKYKDAIVPNSMKALTLMLRADADTAGRRAAVSIRVHREYDSLYLDLGGPDGEVVEVTANGWAVIENPGIPFLAPAGTLPFPTQPSDEINDPLFVVDYFQTGWGLTSAQAFLFVMWLVSVLVLRGPYVILEINGPPRSGRSTLARILKALLDPNTCDLVQKPVQYRDLILIAASCHLLVMAECTTLPPTMLDSLRQIAAGAGASRKRIYKDEEMFAVSARKPVVVISSRPITNQPFCRQRIRFTLSRPNRRRTSAEIWAEFEIAQPHLLAGLLTAAACVLKGPSPAPASGWPGVPDFAAMIAAAAPAFGITSTAALRIYANHIGEQFAEEPEHSPLAEAVAGIVKFGGGLTITATALQQRLQETHPAVAPANSQALGSELARIAPELLQLGITFSRQRSGDASRERLLVFTVVATQPEAGAVDAEPQPVVDDEIEIEHGMAYEVVNGEVVWFTY